MVVVVFVVLFTVVLLHYLIEDLQVLIANRQHFLSVEVKNLFGL